jgi:hypothetical protein
MGSFWERGYLTDRSEPLEEFLGKSSPWAWKDEGYRYGKEGGKASGARQVPQTARETRSVLLRRHYLYRSFALFSANTNSFLFDTNPLPISEFGDLDRFGWRISASSLELGCYPACFLSVFFEGNFPEIEVVSSFVLQVKGFLALCLAFVLRLWIRCLCCPCSVYYLRKRHLFEIGALGEFFVVGKRNWGRRFGFGVLSVLCKLFRVLVFLSCVVRQAILCFLELFIVLATSFCIACSQRNKLATARSSFRNKNQKERQRN